MGNEGNAGVNAEVNAEVNVVTKVSPRSVPDTVKRMTDILGSKGVKLFDVIDQRAEARLVGLDLRETTLVIFGNPVAGTPVMESSPLSALDLPLKILVWDNDGITNVSYYPPDELAARHHLDADLEKNLSAIDALTDALISGS
jgi:uncharacterized protein (DUF302 family)